MEEEEEEEEEAEQQRWTKKWTSRTTSAPTRFSITKKKCSPIESAWTLTSTPFSKTNTTSKGR